MTFHPSRRWRARAAHRLVRLAACVAAVVSARPVAAQVVETQLYHPTRSMYGGIGLIDMPTGRMAPDATMAFTASRMQPHDRITITVQATEWAEASFRYSISQRLDSGTVTLYDRSFDAKVRLFQEDDFTPELSVGLQDFAGTGVFSGEYLAGSKRFGPLDLTLGIGWGRFASEGSIGNPLGVLSDAFERRNADFGEGGVPSFKQFFRGEKIGVFGGIEYTLPEENLTFKAEYSTDSYDRERQLADFDHKLPFNLGVEWEPVEGISLGAAYMYGSRLGLRVTFALDGQKKPLQPKINASPVPAIAVRADAHPSAIATQAARPTQPPPDAPPSEPLGRPVVIPAPNYAAGATPRFDGSYGAHEKLRAALARSTRLGIEGVRIEPNDIWVYFTPGRFPATSQAIGRIARALTAVAPTSVERFHIVPLAVQMPVTETVILRSEMEHLALGRGSLDEIRARAELKPAEPEDWSAAERFDDSYPRFSWSVGPDYNLSLFDPGRPLQIQLFMEAEGSLTLAPGLRLDGTLAANIYNGIRDPRFGNDSPLPQVRSEVHRYLQEGKNGIRQLEMGYYAKLTRELYGRVSLGILEQQYSGVGAELLWRPDDSRIAIGGNIYALQQRAYNQRFGLRDYKTVTGHLSLYAPTNWNDLTFAFHAGRYLARDYGVTTEITRELPNGVLFGAFFTLTDVPFEEFGEGSFDRGIFLRVPLELLLPLETRRTVGTAIRPLTRDGGQVVDGSRRLYDLTRRSTVDRIDINWDRFAE